MNKRQAKRLACKSAREMLEGHAPITGDNIGQTDYRRLSEAWDELLDELYRRGLEPIRMPPEGADTLPRKEIR